MKVSFFQNSKSGGPGLIGEYAEERGWPIRQVIGFEQASGVAAEPMRDDVVVFLGSPRSAFEMDEPWIAHEFHLMKRLLAFGTPVLGVCFGAQLMARVIGGEVRTMDQAFRGWHANEAVADPLWRGPWLRWHNDRIFLPAGVEPLATSEGIVQGFAHANAVGMQFHPEITPPMLRQWIEGSTGNTATEAMAEAERILNADFEAIRRRSFALFEHVFDRLLGVPADTTAAAL